MTDPPPDNYEVGRNRPPIETRWQKGRSGNVRGRPKKATPNAHGAELDMAKLIVAESTRPICITEGGKPVSLPAIDAVLRAMLVSALKGNALAQRTYAQLVTNAQDELEKRRFEDFRTACEMQAQLYEWRTEWLAAGRFESDMPVHPHDIQIDISTGDVRLYLAMTPGAQLARGQLLRFRDHLFWLLARNVAAVREDGNDALLEIATSVAEGAIRSINQLLPPRLRQSHAPLIASGQPDRWAEKIWRDTTMPIAARLHTKTR